MIVWELLAQKRAIICRICMEVCRCVGIIFHNILPLVTTWVFIKMQVVISKNTLFFIMQLSSHHHHLFHITTTCFTKQQLASHRHNLWPLAAGCDHHSHSKLHKYSMEGRDTYIRYHWKAYLLLYISVELDSFFILME